MNIQEQLIREHASLIVDAVRACSDPQAKAILLDELEVGEQNGWGNLVSALRKILNGVLDIEQFEGLDPEDEVIIRAILQGIADPSTLPDPSENHNPMLAPEGLAGIIAEAAKGEENALQMLVMMDKELSESGNAELEAFASVLRRLLNGERNLDSLSLTLNTRTKDLIQSVLHELEALGI